MNTVLDLLPVKAYQYFMEPENYCSLELPCYINFKPVLDYVEKKVGEIDLIDVLKSEKVKPSDYEDVNHKLLVKKDAKYSFRSIQITNPYIYYLLVKQITNKGKWKEIKKRFKEFNRPQIEVSSIPLVKSKKDKSHKSAGVSFWWEKTEQRSIALSLQYKYMFVTDITNCYSSIYTHSIAWALMGKEEAKKKRDKAGLIGNTIDRYIQAMQYGQTNGIPLGSTLYDFIAEMVLGYADMLLADKLDGEGIRDYKILRYRDDYKVFSNSKDEIERIAFLLQEVLAGLNFQLNARKTIMTEEIVQSSIKPDKIAYFTGSPLYKKAGKRITTIASSLQQEALYIHQFGKNYPNSGTLVKLLTVFSQRLTKHKKKIVETDVNALVAILTEVAICNPKAFKIVLHLISFLVEKLPTTEQREKTVRFIYDKFSQMPIIGEVQIWMQHITYQMPHVITYTEPLCRIVANEPDVSLWNIEWLKKEYRIGFPQYKICTDWLRDSFTPVIDIDEVSLFEVY